MCFTVIIGFSIDFVLHIAIAYAQRPVRAKVPYRGSGGGGVYARSERHVRTARAHDELFPAITKAALTTGVMALFSLINPLLTARHRHYHDATTPSRHCHRTEVTRPLFDLTCLVRCVSSACSSWSTSASPTWSLSSHSPHHSSTSDPRPATLTRTARRPTPPNQSLR